MNDNSNRDNDTNQKILNLNLFTNDNNSQINNSFLTSRKLSTNEDNLKINDTNENSSDSEEENYTLLKNILTFYQKGEFSHLLKLIDTVNAPYYSFFYWKIAYIKILSYQEILRYKMYKYFKEKRIRKINSYFSIILNSIMEIIMNLNIISNNKNNNNFRDIYSKSVKSPMFISFKKESKKENKKYLNDQIKIKKIIPGMIETIISHLLEYCFNFAKYCIYKNRIYDGIAILSLGMRLIQKTFVFVTSPDTLLWACNLCLFLSSLLITTKNYSTAKNYIIFILLICLIGLEIRLNNNKDIHFFMRINLDSNNEMFLNRIYFIMSIAFYHFGICLENENNITRAISLYKQSNYFYNKITDQFQEEKDFNLFIDSIINRLYLRLKLISFIKSEEKNKKVVKEEVKIPKEKVKSFEIETIKKKEKKYEKVKHFIESLKLIELDDDEPDLLNKVRGKPYSKKVGIPTKNIHILNYLLDNKFNNFLNKTDKLEINNLSDEERIKIQREIRCIKREELEKYLNYKKDKKLKINVNEEIKFKRNNSKFKNYSLNYKVKNNKNLFNVKRKFNNILTSNYKNSQPENNNNKLLIKSLSDENIFKSSLLNIKTNKKNINEYNNKFTRKMSLNLKSQISLFKDNIKNINNSNMLGLENTFNTLINIPESSTYRNYSSLLDLKTSKKTRYDRTNDSNYMLKLNNTNKKLSPSSISSFNNNIKDLKNNIFQKDKNKLNIKMKTLSESLSYNSNNKAQYKINNNKSKLLLYNSKTNRNFNKSKSQLNYFSADIFNKKLKLKKKYLDSQFVRELKFQKELLKCKSVEVYNNETNDSLLNILNNSFNKQKIYNDCDMYYNRKLKDFMNKNSVPDEKEQLNMLNMILKKEKTEENEEKPHTLSYDSNPNEKKLKRRGGLKEKYLNHNYFFLERIMMQINKLNKKKKLINLKLKENRNKIININKVHKNENENENILYDIDSIKI